MNTSAYTIWLYGSYAREDHDCFSDIDLFVAGKAEFDRIKKHINFDLRQVSISQYEWTEIEAMAAYGSLFLQHLKFEGRPLINNPKGNRRLKDLLKTLRPYRYIYRDIRAFTKCIQDVLNGIERGSTPAFEMSVIATVLRHSAILASYMIGKPIFSRLDPFQSVAKLWGFAEEVVNEFQKVYQFRLHEDGRTPAPFDASEDDVKLWAIRAKKFLDILKEKANAFQERMPAAN
jgi:hypothetical protein